MKKVIFISLIFALFSCKKNSVAEAFLEIGNTVDEKSILLEKEIENKINKIKNDSLKSIVTEYNNLTREYYHYLNSVVDNLNVLGGEKLSESREVNEFFFDKGRGKHFLETTNIYREKILQLTKDKDLQEKINFTLSTENPLYREGKEIDWLEYHFKDFPLFAVIAKLKVTRTDVLQLENEFIDNILTIN